MLEIKPIVLRHEEVDFTPRKIKNDSDIALDVRARLVDESGNEVQSLTVKPHEVVKIPLGFSLQMPKEVKLLTTDSLNLIESFVIEMFIAQSMAMVGKKIDMPTTMTETIEKSKSYQKFFPSSQILSRSGLYFKSNLRAFNGQIDNAFDDELVLALENTSSNESYTIKFGERIGQLEVKLVPEIKIDPSFVNNVNELNGNSRGGFGSSGKM